MTKTPPAPPPSYSSHPKEDQPQSLIVSPRIRFGFPSYTFLKTKHVLWKSRWGVSLPGTKLLVGDPGDDFLTYLGYIWTWKDANMRQKSKLGYNTVTGLNSKGQGRQVGEYFEVVSKFFSISSPSLLLPLHSFSQSQIAAESKAFS